MTKRMDKRRIGMTTAEFVRRGVALSEAMCREGVPRCRQHPQVAAALYDFRNAWWSLYDDEMAAIRALAKNPAHPPAQAGPGEKGGERG